MQVAYIKKMEKVESPRRARRRTRLDELVLEVGSAAQLARETEVPKSHISAMQAGKRGLGDDLVKKLETRYSKPEGWFDSLPSGNVASGLSVLESPNRTKIKSDEVEIPQFQTGGSMGSGLLLRDQPGLIQRWIVNAEWIQKNIKSHTGAANLCIVTGFGDSMKGMFNSGDPLVVDKGVKTVEFDAIYFFRVADEGFIKRLQRIPGEGLRVLSENKKYDSWTIKPGMDFEVFGRVVKAWQGEDF
jgi:hypothetical protein